MEEKITVLSIIPAAKANGKVNFVVVQNSAVSFNFDLTEAQATALKDAITSALA